MAKFIKNIDSVSHTYQGQEIQAGEYYELLPSEEIRWSNDSSLLSDIGSDKAQVGKSSSVFISDYNEQINYLKDNLPRVVQTQFEREDLILKIACAQASVDQSSEAVVEFLIPGTMADGEGRYVSGGYCFFDVNTPGDKVFEISVVDKDNVLGYGANTVLKAYHDDEADSSNQGWYITTTRPLEIETLGFYGFIPSELYLVIKAKKANNLTTGTFYVNIEYGKVDT